MLVISFVLISNTFIFAQKQWNGTNSNEWNNGNNWTLWGVPTSGEAVTIPLSIGTGNEWPTLDANGECGSLTNNGILTISANTLTVNGDFINNGTCSPTGGFLDIKGDFTNNGTFLATGGLVKFSGEGKKNIYGTSNFYDFSLHGGSTITSTVTLYANQHVSHSIYITLATLDIGSYTFDGANGSFHLVGNSSKYGIIKIGGTGDLPTCSGYYSLNPTASTVEYYGANQTISTFSPSSEYGHLIISGTGTKSLQGNISPTTITINSGTLDLGSYTADRRSGYSGELTIANSATLKIGGTGDLPVHSIRNIGLSSTVEYYGSNQTISPGTYGNLTFSGSGTKTSSSNITVNGWLTIYNVTISGNTSGIDNYHFAGSGAQTIQSKTYNNVQISGGSTKTLGGDVTINGALTLTDGKVSLSSHNLTIGSGGSISGTSSSNYIITSGYLRREGVGSNVDFPIGPDASSYNPVMISNSGTSDRFDVHVETGINPALANSSYCLQRTWTISEGTTGGSNTSITFQWASSDENANFTAARTGNRIQAFRYNGSKWVATGSAGGASGSDPYTFTITGVSEFSNFALGDVDNSLPVGLTSFTALDSAGYVVLKWTTESEVDNLGFILYRSQKGQNDWQEIASYKTCNELNGQGNTPNQTKYTFIDYLVERGITYLYRLTDVDRKSVV